MQQPTGSQDARKVASEIDAGIRALLVPIAADARAIRRAFSRKLEGADPEFVLNVARVLLERYGQHSLEGVFLDIARARAGPAPAGRAAE